ncbi:MAG TPA: GAF domain-containing protein [Candidatus Polarisedimenticolia bacterium]|nr:GAF domain-containing protein [Candidatus Polarisedimenticolia bacterium]
MLQPEPAAAARTAAGYRILERITVTIRSRVDLRRVLDLLAADAGRYLDLSLLSIARWDEAGAFLLFSHEYRRDSRTPSTPTLMGTRYTPEAAGGRAQTQLFSEHRPLLFSPPGQEGLGLDDTAEGGIERPAFLATLPSCAMMVAPLVADQRVIGLIVAARPEQLPSFCEEEVEFLRAAADIAAVAVQHATLGAQLRALATAAAVLSTRTDTRTLARRLTEAVLSVTQSTMGLLALREGDDLVCREIRRPVAWEPAAITFGQGIGLVGWSWVNRVPCIANDAASDPRADAEHVAAHRIRSALAVPIVDADGEVMGVFELHNKTAGIAYGDPDILLASAVAHYAAVCLHVAAHPPA